MIQTLRLRKRLNIVLELDKLYTIMLTSRLIFQKCYVSVLQVCTHPLCMTAAVSVLHQLCMPCMSVMNYSMMELTCICNDME